MKIIVIGLGERGQKYLAAIKSCTYAKLIGVCDANAELVKKSVETYTVPGCLSLAALLEHIEKPDLAVVAVPHDQYISIITTLAQHKIHIIKEKPFARNLIEAQTLANIVESNNIHMIIGVQRRFDWHYQTFYRLLPELGKLFFIQGKYNLCIEQLNHGWRASSHQAGGGALLDMGYHFLDLLMWYFNNPTHIKLLKTQKNRFNQQYDVEDTAILTFDYHQPGLSADEKTIGVFTLSRLGHKSQEKIIVRGTEGTLVLEKDKIYRYDTDKQLIGAIERGKACNLNPLSTMIKHFVLYLKGQKATLIGDIQAKPSCSVLS